MSASAARSSLGKLGREGVDRVHEFEHGPCLRCLSPNEAHHIVLTPAYRGWICARTIFSIPRNDSEEHGVGVVHRNIAWSGSLKNPLLSKSSAGFAQKFHADSYGYRPGKSAIDAVHQARQRCWRYDWVLDLDIKGFFDSIDWELLLKAVRHHTDCPWVLLYIERWLKAPMQMEDGSVVPRTSGTPQGGVVSPTLANLFLHYAFDMWMVRTFPHLPFERYADDVICHCKSAEEARALWGAIADRFAACKLVLHPQKTKIVYCKDVNRRSDFPDTDFDFLGFQFRARKIMWVKADRRIFAHSFQPAASPKALTRIGRDIRSWALHHRSDTSLTELAEYRAQRLDHLLQPLLQDAAASDPETDRCLCHPVGPSQVQADAPPNQGRERLV